MWPRVLTTIVFLCGSVTLADELSIKEDPGFEVFRDQCMACHLQTGLGIEAMNAPSIAGLPRWYVTDQLRKFRSDQRGFHNADVAGKLMQANAIVLDERTIAFVGRHIENLPSNAERKTVATQEIVGSENLYKNHCSSCHNEEATGNRSRRAPPLTSQQDWYLLKQIENFQTGKRGHGEHVGMDKLSSEEVQSIVSWIVSL